MLFVPLLKGKRRKEKREKYNQLYVDLLCLISNFMVLLKTNTQENKHFLFFLTERWIGLSPLA